MTTPGMRTGGILLAIVFAASIGLLAAFALDQIRASGTPPPQADAFSTQAYAQLSAPQAFSTQAYAAQHAAPVAPQAFSTQAYAELHD
jgi:hypothetical protein